MDEVLENVYELQMPRPDLPAHLVVSQDEPISCHLLTDDSSVLIGTGYALSADELITGIESVVDSLDCVIVEHGDSDHFGALPELQDRFGEFHIAMPASDIGSVIRVHGSITIDQELQHGNEACGLESIHVPGHTRGNMSFLDSDRDILYVGDTFVTADSDVALDGDWSGAFAPPGPRYNSNHEDAIINLDILAEYEFESALLTHGENVLSDAKGEFEVLLDDINRLGLPS